MWVLVWVCLCLCLLLFLLYQPLTLCCGCCRVLLSNGQISRFDSSNLPLVSPLSAKKRDDDVASQGSVASYGSRGSRGSRGSSSSAGMSGAQGTAARLHITHVCWWEVVFIPSSFLQVVPCLCIRSAAKPPTVVICFSWTEGAVSITSAQYPYVFHHPILYMYLMETWICVDFFSHRTFLRFRGCVAVACGKRDVMAWPAWMKSWRASASSRKQAQ